MSVKIDPAITDQVANPQHCYILAGGDWFRHAPNNQREQQFAFAGKPVRFTRMAAERLVAKWGIGKIVSEEELRNER